MMRRLLPLAVLLVGLVLALAPVTSEPAPPLCRVTVAAAPEALPGLYTVAIRTTTTLSGEPCPPTGYAIVRLESGRVYPWASAAPDRPFIRSGVPWYWRASWQARSGRAYPLPLSLAPPQFFQATP
jgi:hypothetical protein